MTEKGRDVGEKTRFWDLENLREREGERTMERGIGRKVKAVVRRRN